MNLIAPLYAESFGSPFFLKFAPYNKYVSFVILVLLLIFGMSLMIKVDLKNKIKND